MNEPHGPNVTSDSPAVPAESLRAVDALRTPDRVRPEVDAPASPHGDELRDEIGHGGTGFYRARDRALAPDAGEESGEQAMNQPRRARRGSDAIDKE
jgi:hypothetical protein